MKGLRILFVDDEPLMRLSMVDALVAMGCDVEAAASGTEGIEAIRQRPFDLVITDLRLPGADGLTVLTEVKKQSPPTEVMVITAHGSVETAVGAMKLGAFDYITKPFQMDELLLIVERVGRVVTLRRENQDLKAVLEDKFSFGGHPRREQPNASPTREDQAGGRNGFDDADSWRERNRQGAGRQCHPSKQRPKPLPLDQSQLRGASGNLVGSGALRP